MVCLHDIRVFYIVQHSWQPQNAEFLTPQKSQHYVIDLYPCLNTIKHDIILVFSVVILSKYFLYFV